MADVKTAILVRTCSPLPNPTEITYQWAEVVKGQFEAGGWQISDLAANDAVRARVETQLQQDDSPVFLFYGHGLPDQMEGQDRNAVIDLNNLHLLKDRVVYVVACWTAQQLGPASVSISRCYLGYDAEVIVWFPPPYAGYLKQCVNKGILEMLSTPGCTIEHARQHIIDEYNNWIDYFTIGAGTADPWSLEFAADLRHNRDALAQVFGDRTATL
jgi:hypothetical protein